MTRSRKRNRTKSRVASDAPRAETVPLSLRRDRSRRIWLHFLYGLLLTALIIPAFLLAEKIPQVHDAVEISYDWLQSQVASVKGARRSVVFIDIKDLPTASDPAHPEREPHTSRKALRAIVDAVLQHEQKPRAIGIDVDFSLTKDGEFYTPDDRDFLDFLADRRDKQPKLFVGVVKGVENGPSKWLGDPRFGDLAAYVVIPNAEGFGANPWLDERLDIPYIDSNRETRFWPLPSLAAAVAGVPAGPPFLLRWAVERRVKKEEGEGDAKVPFQQFLVDFSPIDDFSEHAIVSADPEFLKTDRRLAELAGKVVIIGRGSGGDFPATDTFAVPGHRHQKYPGVLVHACAAYTLLGATLWRPTLLGRVAADAVFSIVVFGSVALIAWYYNSRVKDDVAMHRLNKLMTWVMVPVVILVGLGLAIGFRTMWADHILVAAGVLLHSSLEQPDNPLRVVGRALRKGWHVVAFERPDQEHPK